MQVKYKSRTSSVIVDDLGESIFIKSKEVQETPKSKGRSRSAIGEDLFNKTSSKLKECNFKHHDPNVCVCEHCTCGRHLCKLHIVRPDMRKAS